MSLADRAERLVSGARRIDRALAAQIQAVLVPARAARRLFLNADGRPTFDAEVFFRTVARMGFADRSTYHSDAREHARREGRREMALAILNMAEIDEKRLAALLAMRGDDDTDDWSEAA